MSVHNDQEIGEFLKDRTCVRDGIKHAQIKLISGVEWFARDPEGGLLEVAEYGKAVSQVGTLWSGRVVLLRMPSAPSRRRTGCSRSWRSWTRDLFQLLVR